MKIKIVVIAHKPCLLPDGPLYQPLLVGGGEGEWLRDNTGEHISEKNPWYCELTGLYWAWKNLEAQAVGLVHYRRYFTTQAPTLFEQCFCQGKWKRILTQEEAEALLKQAPAVLPLKRDYFIESVGSHFAHAHGAQALDRMRGVIQDHSPGALSAWDTHLKGRKTHLCNMFLMRRNCFDAYAEWLFGLLFALEKRWQNAPKRIFGYLAERLLDVWLATNQIPYVETPAMFMERQNWLKKGLAFMARKYAFSTPSMRSGA